MGVCIYLFTYIVSGFKVVADHYMLLIFGFQVRLILVSVQYYETNNNAAYSCCF